VAAAKLVVTCRDRQSQGRKEQMGKITKEAEDGRKIVHQHWLRHVVHPFLANAPAPAASIVSAFGKVAIFKSKVN